MPKQSQIDRAIEILEDQREVIDAALAVLVNLRGKVTPRRPTVVKKPDEKTA